MYVTDGAKITIEAGTKIVSNKDSAGVLVIYSDAAIDAEGTATEPIVFTSGETCQPGWFGWCGLVGQAKGMVTIVCLKVVLTLPIVHLAVLMMHIALVHEICTYRVCR